MEYPSYHDTNPVFLQALPWTLLLVSHYHILGLEHSRSRIPDEMGSTKRAMAALISLS